MYVDPEAARLAVVEALAPTLTVALETDLRAGRATVREYRATINLHWSPKSGPDVDLETLADLSHVEVGSYLPELYKSLTDPLVIPAGHGSFFVADLLDPDCLARLAGIGHDVVLVADALLGKDQDLRDLDDRYGPVQHVLILNLVEIDAQWRGAALGLSAADLVVTHLTDRAEVAALYPMPPGIADLEERESAHRGLARYWARIGFEDYDGIMVRALTETDE